jgi:hypothetical protein
MAETLQSESVLSITELGCRSPVLVLLMLAVKLEALRQFNYWFKL